MAWLILLCAFFSLESRAQGPVSGSAPDTAANQVSAFLPISHTVSLESDPADTARAERVNAGRLAVAGGALVGGMLAVHIYQQQGWWADNRAPFHFQEDLTYGLGVDKIGHFFGASALAFVIGNAVRWANVPEEQALWLASGGSLLFQTYVETEDGFSAWGFDRVDFAANVAGAAWPLARHYVPALTAVELKMSYLPSPLIDKVGGTGFRGQKHLMMDDYEGQTFWLSVSPRSVLPDAAKRYWPEFLGIALGYGARDIASTTTDPYRVVFLSFDYDMTKIIPQHTAFLRTLSKGLNFIHFPAPAVRITPSTLWYGLYF